MHFIYIYTHTHIYIYIYINFSLFTDTKLFPFFFSLFVPSLSYSTCLLLSVLILVLRIHVKPFWVSGPFFSSFPQIPLHLYKNPERLENKDDWPQRYVTKTCRDSNSLHCKMVLSGPYLSRAVTRVLRNFTPWYPGPIMFFSFMFLAMCGMQFDGII